MSAYLAVLIDNAATVTFPRHLGSTAARDGRNVWDGGLAATGGVLRVTQNREIYGQGDAADVFYQVVEGVVRTCRFLNDGRRQIDGFHVAGDVFGFEAGAEHRLSAEAVSDCSLTSHRRQGLEARAATDPALSQQLLSHAMHSMTQAQDHSFMLGHKSAVEKVAAFLLGWARHSAGSQVITLAMTRQDIADYLGLTIETVSRTLSQLERAAVIEIPAARQIRLKDPAALRELTV